MFLKFACAGINRIYTGIVNNFVFLCCKIMNNMI